ncbi:LOW QUALITY PROTEIN: solute carrier family 2, facilitated glucose transporter member 3-like [Paramacrobiotus metropolitanus]|uniref:LOW QUALITY PROTEIN: solute carrier family 2, facilitated glucose transporter member 3-like n=1 Tax=Paramacrobiotus metropolitanus TaxID=2943436 RepID=UPI002445FFAE|nr:LOW QUALITY PROTEIN: solute carrier family 2, facilitated glucose transporter member 3-like [Paramacrobiotus metropolitanus]
MPPVNSSQRLTRSLLLAVFSVTIGTWYPLGFSLTNINAPEDVIVQWMRTVECHRSLHANADDSTLWCRPAYYNETHQLLKENFVLNSLWALVGCSLIVGCFVSIWIANYMMARLGMKVTFYICNAVVAVGVALCGCCVVAKSYALFIIGRFVVGMGLGVSISAASIYIAEISPVRLRGALGTVPSLLYGSGMLTAAILGLPQILGSEETWTGLSWFLFLPVILHFVSLPFCPESPRYLLLNKKDKVNGEKALQWLRKSADVKEEIRDRKRRSCRRRSTHRLGDWSVQRQLLRRNILICVAIIIDQRFTGYVAVYTYSTAIFSSVGLARLQSMYGTIGLMFVQTMSGVSGMLLMDKAGRRKLLIAGNIGCTLAMVLLTVFSLLVNRGVCPQCQWGGLAAVLAFIILFGIGPASVPWVLTAEMFDKSSRSSAMTVVMACCHAAGGTVAAVFPLMMTSLDAWTFLVFAGIMTVFTVFFWWTVVETKGKTFSEIQAILWQKYNKQD